MASIVLIRFKLPEGELRNKIIPSPRPTSVSLPFSLSLYQRTRARIFAVRLNSGDILDDFHRISPATGRLLSSSFRCRWQQGAARDHKSGPKWYLLLMRSIRSPIRGTLAILHNRDPNSAITRNAIIGVREIKINKSSKKLQISILCS